MLGIDGLSGIGGAANVRYQRVRRHRTVSRAARKTRGPGILQLPAFIAGGYDTTGVCFLGRLKRTGRGIGIYEPVMDRLDSRWWIDSPAKGNGRKVCERKYLGQN